MCLAKLENPAPTIARKNIATVTEIFSPAKQELNARVFVCALLEDRSMSFLI